MLSLSTRISSDKILDKDLRLIVRDQITNVKYELKFHCLGKISVLRDLIYQKSKINKNRQRLFYNNYRFKKKDDEKTIEEFDITNNSVLILEENVDPNVFGVIRSYQTLDSLPDEFSNCIFDINQGFISGLIPKLSESGTSGAYFLQNVNRKSIAVFKPRDEEPFMPNNPKGYKNIKGEAGGFRKGIKPGESYMREIAAFLLDQKLYHKVPVTSLVEVYHKKFDEKVKKGSLQLFVHHDGEAENYSYSLFSKEFAYNKGNYDKNVGFSSEVHKIALLDLRILNCDRNDGNILIKKIRKDSSAKSQYFYELIPIDHGLCFPDCIEIFSYEIVWMDWPQIKEPFSKKTLEFIEAMNPGKDVELLCSKLRLRKKCLQNFYLTEILIKAAAAKGLTLHDIGSMIYRTDEDDEKLSEINHLIEKTKYIYTIVKSRNNRSLDRWVQKSIDILTQRKDRKKPKKLVFFAERSDRTVGEPILEEENEEETKQNPEPLKRRNSFSENLSLFEESEPAFLLKAIQREDESTIEDSSAGLPQIQKENSIKVAKKEKSVVKSPESLALKRCLSLPYLKRNDSKVSKSSEGDFELEKDDVGFPFKKKRKKQSKTLLKAEDIYDNVFVYYFESFLSQALERKLSEKNKAKNVFRGRVFSSDVNA